MSAALGIDTMAYFPYCFFNFTNVIVFFTCAVLGFQIRHLEPEDEAAPPPDLVTL